MVVNKTKKYSKSCQFRWSRTCFFN